MSIIAVRYIIVKMAVTLVPESGRQGCLRLQLVNGNVYELCRDWASDYPEGPVVDPVVEDQQRPDGGEYIYKIIRGGSWGRNAADCRSASREVISTDDAGPQADIGFGLVFIPTK